MVNIVIVIVLGGLVVMGMLATIGFREAKRIALDSDGIEVNVTEKSPLAGKIDEGKEKLKEKIEIPFWYILGIIFVVLLFVWRKMFS